MFYSIVIPVYNAQDYIERAIKSIQQQSFQDYEVICIDDGSKDNSSIILDRLCENDERIRVFHCENGGVSKARNTGIDLARGEYILFMDSDDEYVPEALAILYEELIIDKPDFLCFGYREMVYKENQLVKQTAKSYLKHQYSKKNIQSQGLEVISHSLFGSVWSKAYKREILQNKKIYMDEKLYVGEDYCFNLEVLKNVEKFRTIEEPLYIYMIQNDNSIINRYKKDKFEQMYRMHQIRTKFIREYLLEDEDKKIAFINYNYIRVCMSCFMDFSRKECTLTAKEQKCDIIEKMNIEKVHFCHKYMKYYTVPQKIICTIFSTGNTWMIKEFAKVCYFLKFKLGKEV